MQTLIISPGKFHDTDYEEAIATFEKRLLSHFPILWKFPKAADIHEESLAIMNHITQTDYVILLDERGKLCSNLELVREVEKVTASGKKRLVFIIGGAHGAHDKVKSRADFTWSLSPLVFPHQIVRLLLVEQLYRTHSIMQNSKYHHA